QFAGAMRITLDRARDWLRGQMAPEGPILRERSLSFVYKPIWGLSSLGEEQLLRTMLDWVEEQALQPTGDIFLPEEEGLGRDAFRHYRMVTMLRCAAEV